MSYSLVTDNVVFFYDSGEEGDVEIQVKDKDLGGENKHSIKVPYSALKKLVAEKKRQEKIHKLEMMDDDEVLNL